jgi:hypothetical protein
MRATALPRACLTLRSRTCRRCGSLRRRSQRARARTEQAQTGGRAGTPKRIHAEQLRKCSCVCTRTAGSFVLCRTQNSVRELRTLFGSGALLPRPAAPAVRTHHTARLRLRQSGAHKQRAAGAAPCRAPPCAAHGAARPRKARRRNGHAACGARRAARGGASCELRRCRAAGIYVGAGEGAGGAHRPHAGGLRRQRARRNLRAGGPPGRDAGASTPATSCLRRCVAGGA